MALGIAGDADQLGTVRMVGHQRQQLHSRRVFAYRLLDVAGDQEQVLDPRVGHAGEELVEVIAVTHHPRRDMDRHRVPELPQPGRRLDPAVGAVLGRAGDRHPHRLGQPRRLRGDVVEGKHLEPSAIVCGRDLRHSLIGGSHPE
jgi:hypothetical protein